ncbi:hypothetical protein [Agrobacterium genomosp. 13]|uniref:Uncharacterized protein n=1 Tax=Agrobacterium genomosp. 13 str. CFBP 6927 TaxID=1183428 RepID=A0ABM9VB75_9HYPH|nr:hypothetical protein [Agrobacterium genomosp. 13]CUX11523.1 conserved hypothetical protein [Agrobacterium genomosp. 13 str. CFBP 6927]
MKTDRLQNILRELDARLRRSEGEIRSASSNPESVRGMLARFSHLRANIRRLSSKPDVLNFEEVQALDLQIDQLGEAAARAKSNLPTSDPLHRVLADIFEDSAFLSRLTSGLKIGLNQVAPDDLLESTPGQKTAAFQFEYQNDILVVIDQPLRFGERERNFAESAIASAVDHGAYVLADLEGTNVSPRLRDAFASLQATLGAHKNIVQIGQKAQLCGRIVNSEIEELSSTLAALLLGHIEMVSDALSQFEDWRIYCENAAALKVTQGTVDAMIDGTRELVVGLRNHQTVAPEVGDALKTVSLWADGQNPDNRDVLSLARTIENFFAAVMRSSFRFAKDVATDVRKQAVAGVALLIVTTMTVNLVPALSKIPGAEWVQPAASYLKGLATSTLPP